MSRRPAWLDAQGHGPTLLRFMLRRSRIGLPIWVLATGALVLSQSVQSQEMYATAEELAALRATAEGNATIIALNGPPQLLATIGGEVVFEVFTFAGVVVALMSMFLVGRNTRGDEEAGRTELLRSTRVGRHSLLVAALLLAGLANAAVAVVVAAAGIGTGLDAGGSVLLGLALAGVGLTFAGLTAAVAQVFENVRAVYGAVLAVLGATFALRAAGDVGDGRLSWLSPFGWGQRTFPFAGDRWWPLLLTLLATGLLIAAAFAMLAHRDFGAGLIRPRLGRPAASRALATPVGLAWRLQRGALVGWALGAFALGAVYGSLGESMEQFVRDNPEIAQYLPGGAEKVVDSFLALAMVICILLAVAFGVSSALRARGEETSARVEPILATATSRWAWLGSHVSVAAVGSSLVALASGLGIGLSYGLSVSDTGQVPRMLAVALVYVPAVWVVVAVTVLLIGVAPRIATAVSWAVVAYVVLVAFFAEAFELPTWARAASPLHHTPQAPLESVAAVPLTVLALVAFAVAAAGFAGMRRRDITA